MCSKHFLYEMTTHCSDTSEAIELCPSRFLFLKPVAKIHISVQLPTLKTTGKSISNWEVMEKVKATVKPERFLSLKVVKSALEFIRLEGEVETRALIQRLVSRLDGSNMKLSGYPEQLRVRAAEARHMFPARHDWDSYFRGGGDSSLMQETGAGAADMLPSSGQRPDTVHIRDLPCKWFAVPHSGTPVASVPPGIGVTPVPDRPFEDIVRQVFGIFGEIRSIDIPMLDPYREEITAASAVRAPGSIATFSFSQELNFEVFVQYKEYISFVKALEALKGMRLLYKSPTDGNAFTANIKVDFDKTNHMSEKAIKKRQQEREKLVKLEKEREEERKRQERDAEERRKQAESASRRNSMEEALEHEKRQLDHDRKRAEHNRAREERRARKRLERQQRAEQERLQREEEEKRAMEEQRLRDKARREAEEAAERLRALTEQRQTESLRLLGVLFRGIEKAKIAEEMQRRERELRAEQERMAEEERKRLEMERIRDEEEQQRKKEARDQQERELRERLLKKLHETEERQQEERREELRRKIAGQIRLRSTVAMRKSCVTTS